AEVEVLVLDRPNPLGGDMIEGPMLRGEFSSFVGLYTLPMRHGLTMAEILSMINTREGIGCRIEIVKMKGWERSMLFEETGLPWVLPSPNMPTPETAAVYPGMVMLEGTNISEGRGTTRPFEIIGAPWIDGETLARELSRYDLKGAAFRPLFFRPTFDKYSQEICGGVQVHVLDRKSFHPVRCGAAVIASAAKSYPNHFHWKEPPYEYEQKFPPIDILTGSSDLRETVEAAEDLTSLFKNWEKDEEKFTEERRSFFLY
ncbi:MAG: DUF1343 domain-containing protein, partial [Candidatus Krumholzibacteria bacterium]|nr:DUF1343 domain-containing protein [Candidatus Krumholzibacteria bacterium]